MFFCSCDFFVEFLVIKRLDPDPERYSAKMLDSDPESMNSDPQHWYQVEHLGY
jgi:hypothetical protein